MIREDNTPENLSLLLNEGLITYNEWRFRTFAEKLGIQSYQEFESQIKKPTQWTQ